MSFKALFSSFLLCLSTTFAVAAKSDSQQVCSADQLAQIESAFQNSRAELARAADLIDAADPSTIDKSQLWLGAPSSSAAAELASTMRLAASFSLFQMKWCPNVNLVELPWYPNKLAGLHADSTVDIFFGPRFFDSDIEAAGLDSQSSTVSHELFHSVEANETPGPDGGEIYDIRGLEELAAQRPEVARRHAQSLEYLVTDLLHGIP